MFMQRFTKDPSITDISTQFLLQGELESFKFENAIQAVIRNHEILQTAFIWRPTSKDYV